jgi:soluble lytic murein transglycosylase-like protein
MSIEDDAAAVNRRVDSLFAAAGGDDMAPQISSYEGSSNFQALVERQQAVNVVNTGAPNGTTSGGAAVTAPPADISQMIANASASTGVETPLIEAVIKNESGFNPSATSPVGAQGLMQLMPGTAAGLGVTNSYDPQQNINGGAKYLRGLLDEFHGNLPMTIAAYNAGPGAVQKYGGVPPYAETKNYVNNVMASYESYRAQSALSAAPATAKPD